jgi:hypothetical protein
LHWMFWSHIISAAVFFLFLMFCCLSFCTGELF